MQVPSTRRDKHCTGFSANNPGATLCRDCIAEDINHWGFSYWRREHQLLGARWCTRHGNVLHFVDKSDAFDCSPAEMLAHSHPYPVTGLLDDANEGLRRYHQVINLMLKQGAPESLALMRQIVGTRKKPWLISIFSFQEQQETERSNRKNLS